MDQYFNQMEKIIKERKTSSRIRFMLQDVLDLRRVEHLYKTKHKHMQGTYAISHTEHGEIRTTECTEPGAKHKHSPTLVL